MKYIYIYIYIHTYIWRSDSQNVNSHHLSCGSRIGFHAARSIDLDMFVLEGPISRTSGGNISIHTISRSRPDRRGPACCRSSIIDMLDRSM